MNAAPCQRQGEYYVSRRVSKRVAEQGFSLSPAVGLAYNQGNGRLLGQETVVRRAGRTRAVMVWSVYSRSSQCLRLAGLFRINTLAAMGVWPGKNQGATSFGLDWHAIERCD